MTALWVLLGFAVGGVVATLVLRRGGRTPRVEPVALPDAPPAPSAAPAAGATAAGATAEPADTPVIEPTDDPVVAVTPPLPVPALTVRPHPTDPEVAGAAVLLELGVLGASGASDASGTSRADVGGDAVRAASPLGHEDAERLTEAIDAVAQGGTLALPGPSRTVLDHALQLLHARLGAVRILAVPVPRRANADGPGREPLRTLADDPTALAAAGPCVVIVEEAELHLRRGLDRDHLERLRRSAPSAVLLLHVGACEHDASALDDAGRWLDDQVVRVGGDRLAAASAHEPALDLPLMDAVEHAPLLADLAEAAAYARAAGRLSDVPLHVVARVAALLAGGRSDEPAADGQLGAAIASDRSEPPLLHFARLDGAGLAETVRVPAVLVARCAADPAVLGPDLLGVLLADADDVERLLVARRLVASERPGQALATLDALITAGGRCAQEAQLVRGVARDRLGLATAADDYHAVAVGGRGTVAAHAAFLLGGILESSPDLEPARAAYRSAIAADDPVHSAMAAFNLAWLDERDGRSDAAQAAYREIASGTHRDAAPMAALNLATLLERAKRFAECESWYRMAVDSGHPDVAPVAAVSLGLLLERRQRPREARALFRIAAASGHEEAAPMALRRMGSPRR